MRCLPVLTFVVVAASACGGEPPTGGDKQGKVETAEGADTASPIQGPLRINEVMLDNHDSLRDGDGDTPDWVELFNEDGETVDLAGWMLSDDAAAPDRWIAPSTEIFPGQFVIVFASGKGDDAPSGELHASFALSSEGETIYLSRPDRGLADTLVVPALREDESWGPEQDVRTTQAIASGTAARFSTTPDNGWNTLPFDDSTWLPVALAIGFDAAAAGGVSENAALGKPTDQSSDGYGFTGAQAVDGEPSTFSHTGDGDLSPWWTVDLGATYAVDEITILNRDNCCPERLYNATVTVLDDAGNPAWTSAVINPTAEGASPADPGTRIDIAPAALGSSLRIDKVAVNGTYSSEWMSFGEVVVTARLSSPYAALLTTDVGEAMAGHSAGFGRAAFTLESLPARAGLTVAYDDGFVLFINGAQAASANAPIPGGADTDSALAARTSTTAEWYPIDPRTLVVGANLLAFEVVNLAADDDDLLYAPTLTLDWITSGAPALFTVPTPSEPNGTGVSGRVLNPTMTPPRGFFDNAQDVVLACDTPGATLVYTLDGTAPTPTHGTLIPAADARARATTTVPVTTTAYLRAAAFRDGWQDSAVVTHSYLFLADVVHQPALPVGLPDTWDGVSESPVAGDCEMDPEIVNDPTYADDLVTGLRSIPTLSIVVDPDDLWAEDGIYINSAERGDAYERPASVEWILPDGSSAFAETCGLRVHGYGWRYHSSTKKHSFRLQFSRTYGASKLEYPIFDDAPVDRFDSIVLRAGGSKTWLDFRDPANAQYLHDAFARDTARDMGKIDGHATYVHLYLNGLYWGLYNPVERPEAGFGEEYFGGTDEEYDAINRRTVTNEAVDGDLIAYETLLTLADADLTDDAKVAEVEGMLDFDDLIDYMLIHQYTVNRDGPCCFQSNNMRALRRREFGEPFRFFVWDMEYSLWNATDATNVDIDVPGSISHVYTRLRMNAGFIRRFSARAVDHLTGDGPLTPAACAVRYEGRAAEIYDALVAESARWGDTYRAAPYTRDIEWQAEYDRLMTDYFPRRTEELLAQLRAAGLIEP